MPLPTPLRAALLSLLAAAATLAQAAPPRANHPLLGLWKVTLPDGQCFETYHFKPDGRSLVTSAREVAESTYEVSDAPDSDGFYLLRDTIVRDNGQPDCMGEVMTVGHEAVNFLIFHRSGRQFLMCEQARLDSCIGPFVRQDGEPT